jgi:hypothetical protein
VIADGISRPGEVQYSMRRSAGLVLDVMSFIVPP